MSVQLAGTLRVIEETIGSPAVDRTGRTLPLSCPQCQEPIELRMRLGAARQSVAILVQASRLGTELECAECGLRFVYQRAESLHSNPPPAARGISAV